IWLPVVFGLAFWALIDTLIVPVWRWTVVFVATGGAAAIVLVSGGYGHAWNSIAGGPDRAAGTIHALVHDRATFARQSHEQFAPRTFAAFTDERPVVDALRHTPSVRRRPVWVLGDDSAITMMLGKSWPYYFSDMYDTSALAFQKKVLGRLRAHPP